ncbi:hypothetical protein JKP88DRAFT_241089 [Tribonema minus]|uniref:Uncharacterized protein n=1 Tax=Tribonema minus TaxID=303371 RepID=A0A835Z3S0_9STRA|nr:hypothetical protein JKP88DRAFT_241089 [Tribonema minus]
MISTLGIQALTCKAERSSSVCTSPPTPASPACSSTPPTAAAAFPMGPSPFAHIPAPAESMEALQQGRRCSRLLTLHDPILDNVYSSFAKMQATMFDHLCAFLQRVKLTPLSEGESFCHFTAVFLGHKQTAGALYYAFDDFFVAACRGDIVAMCSDTLRYKPLMNTPTDALHMLWSKQATEMRELLAEVAASFELVAQKHIWTPKKCALYRRVVVEVYCKTNESIAAMHAPPGATPNFFRGLPFRTSPEPARKVWSIESN